MTVLYLFRCFLTAVNLAFTRLLKGTNKGPEGHRTRFSQEVYEITFSALLVRFMTKRFISDYASLGKHGLTVLTWIEPDKLDHFSRSNNELIKVVSEMRYNHFTFVDNEIAYFDLLDTSYHVSSSLKSQIVKRLFRMPFTIVICMKTKSNGVMPS